MAHYICDLTDDKNGLNVLHSLQEVVVHKDKVDFHLSERMFELLISISCMDIYDNITYHQHDDEESGKHRSDLKFAYTVGNAVANTEDKVYFLSKNSDLKRIVKKEGVEVAKSFDELFEWV